MSNTAAQAPRVQDAPLTERAAAIEIARIIAQQIARTHHDAEEQRRREAGQ
jgi:hypothetical protein